MAKFCSNCGKELTEGADVCLGCGKIIENKDANSNSKSKIVAGILGLFFGFFGVHNFYLGFSGKGVTQILITLLTCGIGGIWGFIEGILILAGNINKDANGKSLTD